MEPVQPGWVQAPARAPMELPAAEAAAAGGRGGGRPADVAVAVQDRAGATGLRAGARVVIGRPPVAR